jgi:hypothetical protein
MKICAKHTRLHWCRKEVDVKKSLGFSKLLILIFKLTDLNKENNTFISNLKVAGLERLNLVFRIEFLTDPLDSQFWTEMIDI